MLVVVIGFLVMQTRSVPTPDDGGVCTMEAKLCPDGSYVGRVGPNCAFAECPATPAGPISLAAHLNETVSGLDVSITPLAVLEDSRCPVDVQCIQAGTVRIRARLLSGLGEAMQEFKLGQAVTTEAESITLTSVTPTDKKAGVAVKDSEYVFTFEIAKRANPSIE